MFSCGKTRDDADRRPREAANHCGWAWFGNSRGATAVEFAIVLPLFLMIVLGIIEFGRAVQAWNEASLALGKAVRVINLDANKTPSEIATLVHAYLSNVGTDSLSVSAIATTVDGIDYVKISVSFAYRVSLPFSDIPKVTLHVDTLAPVISPTK